MDLAMVLDGAADTLMVHKADCPQARLAAAAGVPVLTMFGVEKLPGPEYPRHHCLDGVKLDH